MTLPLLILLATMAALAGMLVALLLVLAADLIITRREAKETPYAQKDAPPTAAPDGHDRRR